MRVNSHQNSCINVGDTPPCEAVPRWAPEARLVLDQLVARVPQELLGGAGGGEPDADEESADEHMRVRVECDGLHALVEQRATGRVRLGLRAELVPRADPRRCPLLVHEHAAHQAWKDTL